MLPYVGRMSAEVRNRFMSHWTEPSLLRLGAPSWQFSSRTGVPLLLNISANSETFFSVPQPSTFSDENPASITRFASPAVQRSPLSASHVLERSAQ